MRFKLLFLPSLLLLLLCACQKRSNIRKEYWISRQAGVYEIKSIRVLRYVDNNLSSDSTSTISNSTFILKSLEAEGSTCYQMDSYGSYFPQFLNYPSTGFAWTTETDNKRLTFGYIDPSIGYIPSVSLTVDNMGKKHQNWHNTYTYSKNGSSIYVHETIKLERKD